MRTSDFAHSPLLSLAAFHVVHKYKWFARVPPRIPVRARRQNKKEKNCITQIKQSNTHDTVPRTRLCLPPCVALCNSRSARTRCVPQPLPIQLAARVSYVPVLPLLVSSAAVVRLSEPKTPRSLGDILPHWGLSKHSALWSGC